MASLSPTKRSDAVQNRARLVSAARHAFGRVGADVSQDEIAESAGVGVATLYRHFSKREDLVAAVFDQIVTDDLMPALDQAGEAQPADALRLVFERVLTLLAAEPGLLAAAGNFTTVTDRFVRSFLGRLEPLLHRAQDAHEIRADLTVQDLLPVAVMLISTVAGTETTHQNWPRYLALVLDALTTPTPSLLPPSEGKTPGLLSLSSTFARASNPTTPYRDGSHGERRVRRVTAKVAGGNGEDRG